MAAPWKCSDCDYYVRCTEKWGYCIASHPSELPPPSVVTSPMIAHFPKVIGSNPDVCEEFKKDGNPQ